MTITKSRIMKKFPDIPMKGLLLSLFVLVSNGGYGQSNADVESVTVLGSKDILNVCGFVKEVADTLDTASLRVVYRLTYKPAPGMNPRMCDQVLLIGEKYTRCYSPLYERVDSATTELAKEQGRAIFSPQVPLEPVGEVYRDLAGNEFRVIQRVPFQKTYVVSYTEPADRPEWTMCPDTDTVGSYRCHKARTEYGGRTWTAWYAPEISVDAGPWKLCGLPGLILRAADETESYAFTLRSLGQTVVPVVRYTLPSREQTKEKWVRSECGFHMSPTFYFNNGGKNLFFEKGSSVELGKSWSVTYNPIEWPKSE